jgi:hypothetical protein
MIYEIAAGSLLPGNGKRLIWINTFGMQPRYRARCRQPMSTSPETPRLRPVIAKS